MKTKISKFCEEYSEALDPYTQLIKETLESIQQESSATLLEDNLTAMSDASQRMATLLKKVKEQQAYLLIFGPLKSGKSTLMNAVSSTYVSEVTSMPAYPCLVYVQHGAEKSYSTVNYHGEIETFDSNEELQDRVASSHESLAENIRLKEELGEVFNPKTDYPEAIRRVDIHLPIKNLQSASTVLVDTPGLYSRMKFGYDLMTKEIRNTAACAVFVVKTDNLYLEQVFDDFKDLLNLFSRIFLVVNIDSSKRDLKPDGSLEASLEGRDPEKIIQAFEGLAMNAQLKHALDEGKLRIYPIDLLNAASRNLSARTFQADSDTYSNAYDAQTDVDLAPVSVGTPNTSAFDRFMDDLTEYLNSSEYFVEFVKDSLRQGSQLCDTLTQQSESDQMEAFNSSRKNAAESLEDAQQKRLAVGHLKDLDTDTFFESLNKEIKEHLATQLKALREDVSSNMDSSLEAWFNSDESLSELEQDRWTPILQRFHQELTRGCREKIKGATQTPTGGAGFSQESINALSRLDVSLDSFQRSSAKAFDASPNETIPAAKASTEKVIVRRTFWDWILFRSQRSMKEKLFGPDGDRSLKIDPETKKKRLLPDAKNALATNYPEYLNGKFSGIAETYSDEMIRDYVDSFTVGLAEQLETIHSSVTITITDQEQRIESDERILAAFKTLTDKTVGMQDSLQQLEIDYPSHSIASGSAPSEQLDSPSDEADSDTSVSLAPKPSVPVSLTPKPYGPVSVKPIFPSPVYVTPAWKKEMDDSHDLSAPLLSTGVRVTPVETPDSGDELVEDFEKDEILDSSDRETAEDSETEESTDSSDSETAENAETEEAADSSDSETAEVSETEEAADSSDSETAEDSESEEAADSSDSESAEDFETEEAADSSASETAEDSETDETADSSDSETSEDSESDEAADSSDSETADDSVTDETADSSDSETAEDPETETAEDSETEESADSSDSETDDESASEDPADASDSEVEEDSEAADSAGRSIT